MPTTTHLQNDFSSGEISPEMQVRSDLQGNRYRSQNIFETAVATLRNFISDPRGPVRSREGFRYLGVVAESGALPPAFPSACPSETNWTSYAEGEGTTTSDRVGARIQIASDAASMVTASWSDQQLVHVFEKYLLPDLVTEAWRERSEVPVAPEDPGQLGSQGWGISISVSESLGVLAVGTYLADDAGLPSSGTVDLYTGDNTVGWTWNNRVTTPNAATDAKLGVGVGLSGDGSTLVATAPGASRFNTYAYDGGVTYTYTFERANNYPDATESVGSPNGVVLNEDGTTLFIGDVDYGVGSQGRVLIYDRSGVGSDWVLRQEIPRPAYVDIGAPGSAITPNVHKFGQGIATTEDLKDLLITIPGYGETGTVTGMICFYRLNEETNLYDFCAYIAGDKNPGWSEDVDLLFNENYKRFYTGTPDYPGGTFNSVGTVYEYIGASV